MAPGIRPAAISPLMKGSIGASFATESSAPGRGPKVASPARAAAVATTTLPNSAASKADNVDGRGNIDGPERFTEVLSSFYGEHRAPDSTNVTAKPHARRGRDIGERKRRHPWDGY